MKKTKRTKKAKSLNFGGDLTLALRLLGEQHGMCAEHTVKESFCALAYLILSMDGKKELNGLIKEMIERNGRK